jgi:2-deoxy-D-gluconate 3-dehydrogenase
MDAFDLTGKVALVTGGNGGIGLGIAQGLQAAGAQLAITGRNPTKNEAARAQLGRDALAITADVNDREHVARMVAETVGAFGGLDILVANAGMNIGKPPQDYRAEEWSSVVDTNLNGLFACCQAVHPEMRRRGGGKIVTIGSMSSIFGLDMGAAYAATKGAVVQLTKSLAIAWARHNIQVNSILPGWIDTDLTRGARDNLAGFDERILSRTPAGRWGEPADLAGTAVFLCSRASDFVTGTALPVDGGYSCSMF